MFDGDGRMKIDCDCQMERSFDPSIYGDGGINGRALEREAVASNYGGSETNRGRYRGCASWVCIFFFLLDGVEGDRRSILPTPKNTYS